MRVSEFSMSLYAEMENGLSEMNSKVAAGIENSRLASCIILHHISKLKAFVHNYEFSNKNEEINFFKFLKPKFYSKLIYHQKVVGILSHLPLTTISEIKKYFLDELRKINKYFSANHEFVSYFQSQVNSFDDLYFLRKEPDSWLLMNLEDYEPDLNFTTVYDQKVSKIIAFELLSEFIKSSVAKLDLQQDLPGSQKNIDLLKVNWTGSKVSLVELLYALQSTGACNNGTIDLKQLANHFETLFNIDLGNYYRIFQEMRIRKINRTTFLDQLKERLIQRMDDADENPKFKID